MLKTLVFQNLHQIGDTKSAQEYGGLKKNKESKAFCKKLTLRPLAFRGQTQYTQACDLGGIAQRFLDRPEGTFPWKLRQLLEDGTTGPDPAVVQVWQELIGKFHHALMVKYNELPSLFFGWVGEEKERASPACKPLSFGEAAGVFFFAHAKNISLWHRGAPQMGGPQFRWTPSGTGNLDNSHFLYPKTKQDHRTAEPQAVIQKNKRATEQLYTYQPRNYLRDFACTRQQLPAERLYMNERIHRMQRNVAESVKLYHRNSRKRNGELLISIKRGRKLSMIRGSWICRRIHGNVATCWVLIDWKPPVTSRYMSGQVRRMRPAMDSMIELRISFYMFPMQCCKRPPKFQWPPWTKHHNPWENQGSSFWQGAQPGQGWRHLDTCCTES